MVFDNGKVKKNTLLYWLVTMLVFLYSNGGYAQTSQLINKGVVVDAITLEPIIGANIMVKGTTNGTISDIDGNFELKSDKSATLVFSYLGYKTQEVKASNKILQVKLAEDSEMLEDVIIIGYGQVKKGDSTGSLSTIVPDKLSKGTQLTAQDALLGKMAGVNIVPGSGAPGDGGTIRIRMGASLSATNDPLIIIDGIPVVNTSISSINPNDIESFTVLKDASATAIYGSRASNGVILITTKKGSLDSKGVKVDYNGNVTVSEVRKYQDVLSRNDFISVFNEHAQAPDKFSLGDASTNWQKEIYRVAIGTDHNISASGAIKKLPYRISAGYTNQNGIIKTNNYERFNTSIGLSPKFFDNHLSVNLNVKASLEDEAPISSGVVSSAATFDPTRPIHATNDDNIGLGYCTWMNQGVPIVLAASNPIADLYLSNRKNKTRRSIGSLVTNYKVHGFEELQFNLSVGYDVLKNTNTNSTPDKAPSMYTSNMNDGTGLLYTAEKKKQSYLLDFYANYDKTFGDHALGAMLGYGWQRYWYKDSDRNLDHQGNQLREPTHGEGELYLLSYFGRLNYSYASKLLLTATLRADASSRFSKSNRWGYFPSIAAAYRLNEENFFKKFNALSDLKLRFSYGETGQQGIGSYYEHLGTYTMSYDNSRYQFGDEWITLYRPNGYDPNIKWETTSTFNFGLDFGFFNNRISGSVDVYSRKTRDLLNHIFIPAGSNFTNRLNTNIGNMTSKGVELAINAIPIQTKDFEWSVTGNFTWNTSEITKLNTIDTDDNYIKTGGTGGTGNEVQVHKVGYTPNTFFLLKQAYDDNGKPLDGKYLTKDGELTTSEADAHKYVTDKSSRVPYYYGFSTKLTYKKWDLGLSGHGAFGQYVYNYHAAVDSYDNLFNSQGVSSNIMSSTVKTGFTQNRRFSDYFLERGDFFKLDNITLGYTFDKLWNSSSSLRLAASVQNVFVITKYSGVDPEVYSGIDRNGYQRPRIYALNFSLNF